MTDLRRESTCPACADTRVVDGAACLLCRAQTPESATFRPSGAMVPAPEKAPMPFEEHFARTVLARGFRLLEVAVALEMPDVEVRAMLALPLVQRHLERLVATGAAAIPIAGPNEIREGLTEIARTRWETYALLEEKPSIDSYLRMRMTAWKTLADVSKAPVRIPSRKQMSRRQRIEAIKSIAVEGKVMP